MTFFQYLGSHVVYLIVFILSLVGVILASLIITFVLKKLSLKKNKKETLNKTDE